MTTGPFFEEEKARASILRAMKGYMDSLAATLLATRAAGGCPRHQGAPSDTCSHPACMRAAGEAAGCWIVNGECSVHPRCGYDRTLRLSAEDQLATAQARVTELEGIEQRAVATIHSLGEKWEKALSDSRKESEQAEALAGVLRDWVSLQHAESHDKTPADGCEVCTLLASLTSLPHPEPEEPTR